MTHCHVLSLDHTVCMDINILTMDHPMDMARLTSITMSCTSTCSGPDVATWWRWMWSPYPAYFEFKIFKTVGLAAAAYSIL